MLRIRKERLARGWTLAKVCALCDGLDPAIISKVERGVVPPYPSWRRKLETVYGLPGEKLFAEVNEGARNNDC